MIGSIVLGAVGFASAHMAGVGYGKAELTPQPIRAAHVASAIAAVSIATAIYLARN